MTDLRPEALADKQTQDATFSFHMDDSESVGVRPALSGWLGHNAPFAFDPRLPCRAGNDRNLTVNCQTTAGEDCPMNPALWLERAIRAGLAQEIAI
ncbi:hypothetical protein [Neorhizobium vignae]|uniref:hypothetical protein n=1 Tax=Neorhizobium vignae TaxID=690585 RepID=UPI00055DDE88|nr:hypothetical protein [Neorhizobium vignae]